MASATKLRRWIAGGTKETYIGFYDSDGLFCGAAGTLANGEDSGMARFYAVKSMDIAIPERPRQTQTGDDEVQGSLTFNSADPVTAGIQTSVIDEELSADFADINVYDDDQFALSVLNPNLDDLPLLALLTMGTAKSKNPGEISTRGWEGFLFNQCELSQGNPDSITERTLRNYDFALTADQTGVWPWNAELTETNEGTLGGAGAMFGDQHRMMLHAFRADAVVTTVTLDKVPIGDHTTEAVQIWQTAADGTVTKLTPGTDFEVTVATRVVTFGTVASPSAPAAGVHHVIRYQY